MQWPSLGVLNAKCYFKKKKNYGESTRPLFLNDYFDALIIS